MLHSPSLAHTFRNVFRLASIAALVGSAAVSSAQVVVRVPADQSTVQGAINAVPDGGVIEIAQNAYVAPAGGFVIRAGKSFTMRAAAGADVILSGGNRNDIIRFTNSEHTVTFERLIFENGSSTTNYVGGGLTLTSVKAIFNSCTFRNNFAGQANGTGGGALWIASATVSLQDCTFSTNTSRNFGGGVSALNSRVYLRNCSFSRNRVNLANHTPNASGGAVYGINSLVHVNNCAFRENQAGLAGAAVYMAAEWSDPSSELLIADSEFTGNIAERDAAVSYGDPAVGGAIHTEINVSTKVARSRFTNNVARQGGAISLFKSIAEIDSCVFRGNRCFLDGRRVCNAHCVRSCNLARAGTSLPRCG